jgi:hypothetical protein
LINLEAVELPVALGVMMKYLLLQRKRVPGHVEEFQQDHLQVLLILWLHTTGWLMA